MLKRINIFFLIIISCTKVFAVGDSKGKEKEEDTSVNFSNETSEGILIPFEIAEQVIE